MLEAVETAGRTAVEPEPEADEQSGEAVSTAPEQDFLTKYFDKLAATPDEESEAVEEPTAPPAEEPALGGRAHRSRRSENAF